MQLSTLQGAWVTGLPVPARSVGSRVGTPVLMPSPSTPPVCCADTMASPLTSSKDAIFIVKLSVTVMYFSAQNLSPTNLFAYFPIACTKLSPLDDESFARCTDRTGNSNPCGWCTFARTHSQMSTALHKQTASSILPRPSLVASNMASCCPTDDNNGSVSISTCRTPPSLRAAPLDGLLENHKRAHDGGCSQHSLLLAAAPRRLGRCSCCRCCLCCALNATSHHGVQQRESALGTSVKGRRGRGAREHADEGRRQVRKNQWAWRRERGTDSRARPSTGSTCRQEEAACLPAHPTNSCCCCCFVGWGGVGLRRSQLTGRH